MQMMQTGQRIVLYCTMVNFNFCTVLYCTVLYATRSCSIYDVVHYASSKTIKYYTPRDTPGNTIFYTLYCALRFVQCFTVNYAMQHAECYTPNYACIMLYYYLCFPLCFALCSATHHVMHYDVTERCSILILHYALLYTPCCALHYTITYCHTLYHIGIITSAHCWIASIRLSCHIKPKKI